MTNQHYSKQRPFENPAAGNGQATAAPVSVPQFGIYVHWPFCEAKCPYCDFNSHVRHGAIDQRAFVSAFEQELAYYAERLPGRTVGSVFFGGGTPSLMEAETVQAILRQVDKLWGLDNDVEITLEANPSSVEAKRFSGFRAAGVNRVSLGVQSLKSDELRFLGRVHSVEQALMAIETARSTFDRLSFDLIYARPGQSVESWREELTQAIDLAADHLSLYQLTIERDTPFAALRDAGKLIPPDVDLAADLYEVTQEITANLGLFAYETSNHARPGAECRHNLLYWRAGEYVGVGPGAHGRIDLPDGRHATAIERHPEKWLGYVAQYGHGQVVDDLLTSEERGDEFLLMGLRLTDGIDLDHFEAMSSREIDPKRIQDLIEHEMIEAVREQTGGRIVRATPKGALVLDAVVADLAS